MHYRNTLFSKGLSRPGQNPYRFNLLNTYGGQQPIGTKEY